MPKKINYLWYLRLRSKYRHFIDSSYSSAEKPGVLLRAPFRCLEPALFADLDHALASTKIVSLEYPNLKRVNEYLQTLVSTDVMVNKLETKHIVSSSLNGPLDGLFIADGFYVDGVRAVQYFKDMSLRLVDCLEKTQTHTTGISGYNYRILNRFYVSIVEIAAALREYSHGR